MKNVQGTATLGWSLDQLDRQARCAAGQCVVANMRKRTDEALVAWAKAEGRFVLYRPEDEMGQPIRNARRRRPRHRLRLLHEVLPTKQTQPAAPDPIPRRESAGLLVPPRGVPRPRHRGDRQPGDDTMTSPHVGADTPVTLTFFPDFAAATKSEERLVMRSLADRIRATTAARKAALPWLKMGRFGDTKTLLVQQPNGKWTGGSLRHNANLLTISGLEGDYDGEEMSFDAARAILIKAGVLAILYTSPSHTEDLPRWRVLAPLSAEYPPERRDQFMGRLNGLVGGVFSRESWTLSQSYYFGSVKDNPSHRAELIPGTPIDLMPELDADAIGKPGATAASESERPVSSEGAGTAISDFRLERYRLTVLDTLRREAVDGQKHFALLRISTTLGGFQAEAGFTDAEAWAWLKDCLPDSVLDWAAAKKTALDGLKRGRAKPIVLEDRPRPASGTATPFGVQDRDAESHAANSVSEVSKIGGGDGASPPPSRATPPKDKDGDRLAQKEAPRPDRDAKDERAHRRRATRQPNGAETAPQSPEVDNGTGARSPDDFR